MVEHIFVSYTLIFEFRFDLLSEVKQTLLFAMCREAP